MSRLVFKLTYARIIVSRLTACQRCMADTRKGTVFVGGAESRRRDLPLLVPVPVKR